MKKIVTENNRKKTPEGYKQTEVGIIPEDWSVSSLGALAEKIMVGIASAATHAYCSTGIPMLRNQNIKPNKLDSDDLLFINKQYEQTFKNKRLKKGDLLTARTGYPGTTCIIPDEFENAQSFTTLITRPTKKINSLFLSIFMNSEIGISFFERNQIGGGQKNINAATLKTFIVATPSLQEQTAIANVLSDIDALITELEKKITKKQAIKTATMQQLLTGRTRLSHFSKHSDGSPKGYMTSELGMIPEDWEAKPFGELFESLPHRRTLRKEDIVSFVGMQDVSENAQLIKQTQLSFSEMRGGFTYFERGDVLVAKITPCFENGKGCHTDSLLTDIGFGSTEFHVLRAKNSSHSKFIYYWTTDTNLRKALESEMVGSAGHRRVPLSAMQNYLIPCPQTKVEQTAIAAILFDMDTELEALEQKISKVRDIKQGMMQQLLTGRIRLPLDRQP
ncbi:MULTISPECIES: restriction endonuclease subunit S [Serratia]|uniref:restriction endonuclease subunit S n=1 Tax=Serratia TaxID=613 RepID=UPI00138A5B46|nr:restriction endonuclease subunit S [Serratia marcescens]ELH4240002.1 restriction endonuclease subunit S [Serratia marcescens]MBH3242216.1 restriction endonuclease subunit S [Serratia marcescens]MBN5411612.1 restriction endonuclease subunit S [Serratia marcescens]NDJ38675.1 restriction endonuclease subunit S [Serratia marcescens]WAZ11183.1 restriction endonuclease subunit S [Serratia marcescens]